MTQPTYEDFLDLLPRARQYEYYIHGLCPFHDDKSPSLMVFKDNKFKCLACNEWGSHRKLANKLQGWEEPVTHEGRGWSPPFLPKDLESFALRTHANMIHRNTSTGYLLGRGVSKEIMKKVRIGFHDGWYVIPNYNHHNRFQGLVLRAGPTIQEATGARFVIPHRQKPSMFVPDWDLWWREDVVFVVFGIFDALVLASLGFAAATSTGNKYTFKSEWLDEVRKHIIIIPDRGEEPEAYRVLNGLGWRGRVGPLPYGDEIKDPADYYTVGKEDILKQYLLSGREMFT